MTLFRHSDLIWDIQRARRRHDVLQTGASYPAASRTTSVWIPVLVAIRLFPHRLVSAAGQILHSPHHRASVRKSPCRRNASAEICDQAFSWGSRHLSATSGFCVSLCACMSACVAMFGAIRTAVRFRLELGQSSQVFLVRLRDRYHVYVNEAMNTAGRGRDWVYDVNYCFGWSTKNNNLHM